MFSYKNRFGRVIEVNHSYMEEPPWAPEVSVGELSFVHGATMRFLYDFGDNWEFIIRLERIGPEVPNTVETKLLESYGTAPDQYPHMEE